MIPIRRVARAAWEREGSPALLPALEAHAAVVLRGALEARTTRMWTRAVRAARSRWTSDFRGEQFSLGRAFYTHYETDRSALYFTDQARSDATVEAALPGMQAEVRGLFATLVGGVCRQRPGFCGPGVHIFVPNKPVAQRGGVVHYDVEGLSPLHLARRHRALSLVLMLQPAQWGGGLRLWDARFRGHEEASAEELAREATTLRYGEGDALLMSSYQLHQIRPFRGTKERISITLHAVEVDRDVWEAWF